MISSNPSIFTTAAPWYNLHAPKNVPDMLAFWNFAIHQHARRPVRDVLEFGCGTGRFLLPLAKEGCQVVGTDASEAMLTICRDRATELGLSTTLRHEPMQDFVEVERYDALVAIYGLLAFLVDDHPIRHFLSACHQGLRPGGFLLIDVANGLDGLVHRWAKTTAEIHAGDGVVLERFLQQIPDTLQGTTRYRDTGFVRTDAGNYAYQEEYLLRIFSLPLLRLLLENLPFQQMTCYCNWQDRNPMQPPYSRLIVVLEK